MHQYHVVSEKGQTSIWNPHGCFTIHSTTSTALVYNAVSPSLANQVRKDRGYVFSGSGSDDQGATSLVFTRPFVFRIYGSCQHTSSEKRWDVPSTTLIRYIIYSVRCMDICNKGNDWTHIYLIKVGSRFHLSNPYCCSLGKNDVSIWFIPTTPYDT